MKLKKLTLLLLLGSFAFLLVPVHATAAIVTPTIVETEGVTGCTSSLFAPLRLSDLPEMSRKEVELTINRRLKLKERITLKVLKHHVKRMTRLGIDVDDCIQLEKKASNGVIFGIIGLFFAGIILGILAISAGSKAVKLSRANPDCPDAAKNGRKGNTGIVLGVIDIIGGIIFIALLL
ncbi:MAG: hypothetical protein WBA17_05250 [Saprospiraceae bacterium]